MKSRRLGVLKTYKLYIGGKFPRTESGRYLTARDAAGNVLGNYCHASRKDLRDAVVAARKAQAGWAKQSAYLRGQILYRAGEMLESRSSELVREVARGTGLSAAQAESEVFAAIDRLVYFAGWTDKFSQVFGAINPVASSHFNFTTPEPTGVVAILCPDSPSLIPLVTLLASVILSGNAAIVVASETTPLPAVTFSEILATSDLPGGIANILTGRRDELLSPMATHMDINAIVDAGPDEKQSAILQGGVAANLKRYVRRSLAAKEWVSAKPEDPYWIGDTIEFKTAWHPIGV